MPISTITTFCSSTTFNISITDEANEVPRFQLIVNRIPDEGGLTTGAGLHEEGTTADLSATAGPGYTFAGWTGDLPEGADSGDALLSVTMDSDKTINAYFARSFHDVSVAVYPERHGYAHGGGSILSGTQITLTAEEFQGKDHVPFSHWRINDIDHPQKTSKTLTLTVEQDLKIQAIFDLGLPDHYTLIPGGSYTRAHKTKYQHTASVSAFYTSTHETSKAQWYKVYNWAVKNGYNFESIPGGALGRNRAHNDPTYHDDYPITGIYWRDIIKWCNARSEMEGWTPLYYEDDQYTTPLKFDPDATDKIDITSNKVQWRERGYRIPTETEWERAARGGLENLAYPNGNLIDETQAFYNQKAITRVLDYTTQSQRLPNAYGLYDMVGNAWEVTWDWYSKEWYLNPNAELLDNIGPEPQETEYKRDYRVARGGSAHSDHRQLNLAGRYTLKTWFQYAITLRPVFPAPSEPDATIIAASPQAHLGNVTGTGIYPIGTPITLTATPIPGATFIRWQDAQGNPLSTNPTYQHQTQQDQTLYAVFEDTTNGPPLYTLLTQVKPQGTGTVTGKGAYLPGSTIEITATPIEGLNFAGWSGDAFGTNAITQITLDKNKIIAGTFGDTSQDSDNDTVSDLYENILGSNPFERDSDGDKITDGDEINIYNSNPTSTDTDQDGYDDYTETIHNTSLIDPNQFPFFPFIELKRYFIFSGKPKDFSGNRGDGIAADISYTFDRWYSKNSAYAYNGTNSYVEAKGYNGPTGATARTHSGWIRTQPGNTGPILSYGTGSNTFSIDINPQGNLQITADAATLTGTTDIADDAWHQFVVTLPQDGTPADITIYIDAQLETTTTEGTTDTPLNTKTKTSLLLGKNPNTDEHFTGRQGAM